MVHLLFTYLYVEQFQVMRNFISSILNYVLQAIKRIHSLKILNIHIPNPRLAYNLRQGLHAFLMGFVTFRHSHMPSLASQVKASPGSRLSSTVTSKCVTFGPAHSTEKSIYMLAVTCYQVVFSVFTDKLNQLSYSTNDCPHYCHLFEF